MTVVDKGDLPESKVSIPELSELAHRWPPAVITHMRWRQPELEELKQAARVQYRKKQPAACEFCGTMIRCDMYRHVARCHLELAQLSLTHHYRVHRRGVPHVTFRRNYMSQLRALLPLPAVLLTEGRSPDPGSLSVENSPDVMTDSSRPSRRTFVRRRLTQIRETPRRIAPRLTEQDTLAAAGSMVFDCRPQVLPGAMVVSGSERFEIRSMTTAPPEHEQSFGGGDLLSLICPELGVAPLVDPGTDCEDELPTPACPLAVVDQQMDRELQNVFIDVVSLPTMVTPVCDIDGTLRMPRSSGLAAVGDIAKSDLFRLVAGGSWSAAISVQRNSAGDANLQSTSCGALHDGNGIVAPSATCNA